MKQLTDFMRTFLPWASRQCRYSALSLMLLIGASALAQGIAVKGTVVDSNGDPLIGASVVIKGNSSIGTITDFDGNFALSVPSESSTIVISLTTVSNTVPPFWFGRFITWSLLLSIYCASRNIQLSPYVVPQ